MQHYNDFKNIVEIYETRKQDIVNERLKNGWKLIAVSHGQDEHQFGVEAYILYSLVLINEDPEF